MKEFDLTQVITEENLIINSTAKNKDEVLNELTELLENNGYVDSSSGFLEDVYARELEGITGIGSGIAIPHGKSPFVQKTTIAIVTLKAPIQWETLDDEPIHTVILFAVQDTDANTKHILLLQQVAILLANDDFIADLANVDSKEQLMQVIQ